MMATETEVSTNQALLTGRMPEEETKAASELNNIIHPITATDMERFIYMFADRFFHIHQHEYPQTVKVFQEFKTVIFNERIMNNRTPKQLQQQATISTFATATITITTAPTTIAFYAANTTNTTTNDLPSQ